MSLYQEIIFLGNFYDGLYVVENVAPYYKPLIAPRLIIDRHLFWSNALPYAAANPQIPKLDNFIDKGDSKGVEELKKWLGIHFEGNIYMNGSHNPGQCLRNCVHPVLGKYIFDLMMKNK